ncbi:MAG: tRNA pseudouridine(38-40) synthase TruA [Bacillota bacterium]|nr:tRNA pseudouridine(38-40) synthase TruA [Bacillota bacterium]
MTRRLKITVSYDGGAYCGFQRQGRGLTSVQDVLYRAIEATLGPPARFAAAGRTDSGVHALGQVIAFDTEGTVPAERVPLALNANLPGDVSALAAEEVPFAFHPRFHAQSKTYAYTFYGWQGDVRQPLLARHAYEVRRAIDLAAMDLAARRLVGRHDFSAFQDVGRPVRDAARTVFRCEVGSGQHCLPPWSGSRVGFVLVEADGFLYHMVRIIAGTLFEVGRGRMDADAVAALLTSGARRGAGPTVPAHGLCLLNVKYSSEPAPHAGITAAETLCCHAID